MTRRGNDVDSSAARHLSQKTDVAAKVERRHLDDRLDARIARLVQGQHGLVGELAEVAEQLRIGVLDAR
jgi:hypothetical protein